MNREPILILSNIIESELGLANGRVWIYNQDYKMPEDSGLFVALDYVNSEPYAVNRSSLPIITGGEQETVKMLAREEYAINILSKDSSARMRKEEVLMALNSTYSEQQQELYEFKIAQIPSGFTNVSELEGAGMLNRFVINIAVLAWYSKTKEIPYFDQFSNQIIYNT